MKAPLLFLSPVMPAPTGNGPAMRSYAFLRVLSTTYDVSLLVTGVPAVECPELHALCRNVAVVPLTLWPDRHSRLKRILASHCSRLYGHLFPQPFEWWGTRRLKIPMPFGRRDFDVTLVFRLYMTPVWETLRRTVRSPSLWLDMDDVESATRNRMADLHHLRGEIGAEAKARIEAAQYGLLEQTLVPRFDRVFVCSAQDRDLLVQRGIHRSPEVAPNTVTVPSAPTVRERGAVYTFLFVGSLGYLPNADGVQWLCTEVLPRLRELAPDPFRVQLVGRGRLPVLPACPEVEQRGFVDDVEPYYASADTVVVPLRAGGGTSIKLIEAMAHGIPVVSTAVGARGLDLLAGRDLLVADSPESFAAACADLMKNEDKRRGLGAAGRSRVETSAFDRELIRLLV